MNERRSYQAEVHFALATIIQGITITSLGEDIAITLRQWSHFNSMWIVVTAIASLLIAVTFWYAFVMAYFHRFRTVVMTASNHFWLALLYFCMGMLQIISFQFLDDPRTWLTINNVLVITVTTYLIYADRMTRSMPSSPVVKLLNTEAQMSVALFGLPSSAVLTLLWWIVPQLATTTYAVVCLSTFIVVVATFNVVSVRVFQRRLDQEEGLTRGGVVPADQQFGRPAQSQTV